MKALYPFAPCGENRIDPFPLNRILRVKNASAGRDEEKSAELFSHEYVLRIDPGTDAKEESR